MTPTPTKIYHGRCLCGAISFTAKGAPVVVAQCHCDACRHLSGAGHTIGAMFPSDAVTMNGQTSEYQYSSDTGPQVTKTFCATCGSPIYGQNSRIPNHMTLPLGTMDNPEGLSVEVVIFERDRPHWDQLADNVQHFQTQPAWQPETEDKDHAPSEK